ncbi:FecCD family ABC transporter permease [Paracoccus cavernae]|uniref:FecCD family ABC transporter permease n=1 Tax=Paracoccus cavernae TaxID=1571207 RepID=UPI0035F2ECA6
MNRLALLVLALSTLILAGICVGEVDLPASAYWQALTGESPSARLILWELRLPRILTAAGAGAALGLSGAIFQMVLRNPLASPDVMGFTSGAAFGTVLALRSGGAAGIGTSLGAAGGGLAAAALVFGLSRREGRTSPLRLVLVGIGIAAAFGAGAVLLLSRLPLTEAADAQRWLAGSLVARDWHHVRQIALSLVLVGSAAAAMARALALLELGDDLAATLGLGVERARLGLTFVAVLAATAAVSVAGPLPFIALMAAPLSRRLGQWGAPGARMAAAGITGALIATLADLLARIGIGGIQLPVGALTGLLGGPYLLWLLAREMKEGQL